MPDDPSSPLDKPSESRRQELRQLRDFYRDQLLDDCIPFWFRHAMDSQHGGIMTSVDRDGSLLDSDKGVWQQGRFIWMVSRLLNDPRCKDRIEQDVWRTEALKTGNFLQAHGFDPGDGRMWFHLDRKGNPIRKRRYAFSESFAAIAFGELSLLTGDRQLAELARQCFARFRNHIPAPKSTPTRPSKSLGVPMISIVTGQQLRRSIGLDCDSIIEQSIEEILRDFVKPNEGVVMESVSPAGDIINHFDGRTLNPGHAIEAAWFLMEEGTYRNRSDWFNSGCQMLDWMFERGWDQQYGGLLYFVDLENQPVQEYWHDMKFWWPHNEALIASLYAYCKSGLDKYWNMHQQLHHWSFSHFADPDEGEWFGYLHRDGSPSVTLKGNLWKGPFHYPRMLYQCWSLIDQQLNH